MRFQGNKDSPAKGACHLIAYGIEGKQSDVDSDVYDALFVVENNTFKFGAPIEVKDPVDPQNPVTNIFFDELTEPVFFIAASIFITTRQQ